MLTGLLLLLAVMFVPEGFRGWLGQACAHAVAQGFGDAAFASARGVSAVTALLVAEGASKFFGGLAAVSDVTLEVDKGDIHCLIGPNGAGKSTLFRLIVGMYPPTARVLSISTAST